LTQIKKVWLFGGFASDTYNLLNDLWNFDGFSWTWISGSNQYNQSGNYGTLGTPSSSNIPGARYGSTGWIDSNNNLWLFGGYGFGYQSYGYLNDLWKFDGSNWVFISGSNQANQNGNYGIQGISSSSNIPGARYHSTGWIDTKNNFWLFGGSTLGSPDAYFNDLWKFDGFNWIWISGSNQTGQSGNYGTLGISSSSNIPGARHHSVGWIDTKNNLWLFGGYAMISDSSEGFNDLWKFDIYCVAGSSSSTGIKPCSQIPAEPSSSYAIHTWVGLSVGVIIAIIISL